MLAHTSTLPLDSLMIAWKVQVLIRVLTRCLESPYIPTWFSSPSTHPLFEKVIPIFLLSNDPQFFSLFIFYSFSLLPLGFQLFTDPWCEAFPDNFRVSLLLLSLVFLNRSDSHPLSLGFTILLFDHFVNLGLLHGFGQPISYLPLLFHFLIPSLIAQRLPLLHHFHVFVLMMFQFLNVDCGFAYLLLPLLERSFLFFSFLCGTLLGESFFHFTIEVLIVFDG